MYWEHLLGYVRSKHFDLHEYILNVLVNFSLSCIAPKLLHITFALVFI